MLLFRSLPLILALTATALAGCASVTTEITVLDPAHKFAPTEYVMVLLDYPPKPYVKIALIEAQGIVGGSEAALLEEARKRGAALGADAIVRQEVTAFYQPPVLVYDPAYANSSTRAIAIRTARSTTPTLTRTRMRRFRTTATGGLAAAKCKL